MRNAKWALVCLMLLLPVTCLAKFGTYRNHDALEAGEHSWNMTSMDGWCCDNNFTAWRMVVPSVPMTSDIASQCDSDSWHQLWLWIGGYNNNPWGGGGTPVCNPRTEPYAMEFRKPSQFIERLNQSFAAQMATHGYFANPPYCGEGIILFYWDVVGGKEYQWGSMFVGGYDVMGASPAVIARMNDLVQSGVFDGASFWKMNGRGDIWPGDLGCGDGAVDINDAKRYERIINGVEPVTFGMDNKIEMLTGAPPECSMIDGVLDWKDHDAALRVALGKTSCACPYYRSCPEIGSFYMLPASTMDYDAASVHLFFTFSGLGTYIGAKNNTMYLSLSLDNPIWGFEFEFCDPQIEIKSSSLRGDGVYPGSKISIKDTQNSKVTGCQRIIFESTNRDWMLYGASGTIAEFRYDHLESKNKLQLPSRPIDIKEMKVVTLDPDDQLYWGWDIPDTYVNKCLNNNNCPNTSCFSDSVCSDKGICFYNTWKCLEDGNFCNGETQCNRITSNCELKDGISNPCANTGGVCSEDNGGQCYGCVSDYDCDGIAEAMGDNCQSFANFEQFDKLGSPDYGDACECEGNFNNDDDVDGSDVKDFKNDFARNNMSEPCTASNQCYADFDCDNDTDGTDAFNMKSDFGRNSFDSPCPAGNNPFPLSWCF